MSKSDNMGELYRKSSWAQRPSQSKGVVIRKEPEAPKDTNTTAVINRDGSVTITKKEY